MGKITAISNGDTGLVARSYINEAMKTVEIDTSLTGDGTVGNALGVDLLDEDNMASDSAVKAATQQSIKAYVDSQVAGIPTITTSAAGNYTVLTTDYLIRKTGITAGGDTVTLPSGAATGQVFIIKDSSGGAAIDNITIDTAGAETIDGSASVILNTNYGAFTFFFDGTNYEII